MALGVLLGGDGGVIRVPAVEVDSAVARVGVGIVVEELIIASAAHDDARGDAPGEVCGDGKRRTRLKVQPVGAREEETSIEAFFGEAHRARNRAEHALVAASHWPRFPEALAVVSRDEDVSSSRSDDGIEVFKRGRLEADAMNRPRVAKEDGVSLENGILPFDFNGGVKPQCLLQPSPDDVRALPQKNLYAWVGVLRRNDDADRTAFCQLNRREIPRFWNAPAVWDAPRFRNAPAA